MYEECMKTPTIKCTAWGNEESCDHDTVRVVLSPERGRLVLSDRLTCSHMTSGAPPSSLSPHEMLATVLGPPAVWTNTDIPVGQM